MTQLPATMQAMVLQEPRKPLIQTTLPLPSIADNEILIKTKACGVCRTDLHIVDGELQNPKLPLIIGHEIIGTIVQVGQLVNDKKEGDMVGVPWLGYACGECKYCLRGQENLCQNALFTGYTKDGGYAEYTVADSRFCIPLPDAYTEPSSAPLLCAGLIGYRSYSMIAKSSEHIGFYGFGAAAHILIQVAVFQHKKVYAFTCAGDDKAQQLALSLGAVWAGDSTQKPPVPLDAAILFAPDGRLVVKSLQDSDRGASVICGGIHMSDIPSFSYDLLWGERMIKSVANLTRKDATDFFSIIQQVPVATTVQFFSLQEANEALQQLRKGEIHGAAVLVME